jgi:hypothetical protein
MPLIKLRQDVWHLALSSYPDHHFADSIVDAIKYGVHLRASNVHVL